MKLEKIPMELLILLVSRRGELVSRDEIIAKLWGRDVFIETEHGINTAVRKIRQALEDDPERPRFVQTVVGKGYRFVGPISVVDAEPAVVPSSAPVPVLEEKTGRSRREAIPRWVVKASVAALILLGAVAMAVRSFDWARWLPRPPVHSIAVLPLKNLSANPSDEYFVDGMTDELITSLAKISALRVTSYTSVSKFKPPSKSLPQIAQELHVDAIVEGSVLRSGDQVRITAQLIYAPRDQHLWAEEYQRNLRDVLYLQREVARDIAQQVRVTLTADERQRLATAGAVGPRNPEAYQIYLKARYYWNMRDPASIKKSIALFRQALDLDPNYALAYAGIGDAYQFGSDSTTEIADVRRAYDKALELDDTLAEAHAGLGIFIASQAATSSDWEASERELNRAIELNPSYASARQWHSNLLAYLGRNREAMAEALRAVELDPLSPIINTTLGYRLAEKGKYDEAIAQYRRVLEMTPGQFATHDALSNAYIEKGMFNEAITERENYETIIGAKPKQQIVDDAEALRQGYQRAGPWGYWQKLLELKLHEFNETKDDALAVPIATCYARLGQDQKALKWLTAVSLSADMADAKRNPAFRHLHSNPQFQQELLRVGLPP